MAHAALAQVEANARGMQLSDHPEFLHQLRVGLRRLRSALRAFRTILPRKEARRLRRALRKLSPELGPARDWDVVREKLAAARVAPGVLARTEKRRSQARQAARRAVRSKAFAQLIAQGRALVAQASPKTLAEFGATALARAHGKLVKEARDVEWSNPARRHAVRIRVKRLRYSCEFFAGAFPAKRAAPYLRALKELQTILGELNDIAVGRRLTGLQADEKPLLRRLDAAWKRFAKRPPFWRAPA